MVCKNKSGAFRLAGLAGLGLLPQLVFTIPFEKKGWLAFRLFSKTNAEHFVCFRKINLVMAFSLVLGSRHFFVSLFAWCTRSNLPLPNGSGRRSARSDWITYFLLRSRTDDRDHHHHRGGRSESLTGVCRDRTGKVMEIKNWTRF